MIQKERPIEVKSPLGEDVLLFRSMTGTEQLGRLFEYDLDLLSTNENIKLEDVLGQPMTIRLTLPEGERFFNGVVSRFSQTGRSGHFAAYQATLRPWVWFLTRTADCRIFQEMKVPDIIKKVFRDLDFSDFEESLSASYRQWEYCVQYRETDFDFVSRLMEQEGIYYFFKHSDGKHSLVLSDDLGAHSKIPGYEKVAYYPPSENALRKDHVYDWYVSQEVQPGAFAHTDFDFQKPKASLATKASRSRKSTRSKYEIYDYPGEYLETGDGDHYAKARIEELQWQCEGVRGVANARGFTPGGLFELTGYPREDQNREYLIMSVNYELVSDDYLSGASESRTPTYTCRFTAIESKQPYRSPRFTPKPVIHGCQTAIVVGPSGEEIYTDKYGRVKVQFHWDREGKNNENSSCWMRVASVWAGKEWGGIHIPRMGQEVLVDFLEGDPDRPIITGRVYNADNMPPYGLPANMTQSGIKSRSSKGGGPANFNEIRFEDKKGSEELYLHAEKNHTNITENDRSEDVGHDRSLHVGHDKSETIDNNKSITVAVDHAETIGSNKTLSVGANHEESIGATKSLTVGASHTESIGSTMTITVGTMLTELVGINYAETVGAAMELTVGAVMTETVGAAKIQTIGGAKVETIGAAKSVTIGGSHSVKVGGSESVKVGGKKSDAIGGDASVSVGGKMGVSVAGDVTHSFNGAETVTVTKDYALKAKKVILEAEDEIQMKTGSATITLKSGGDITIDGSKITIHGSGEIIVKGSKISEN